MRIRARSSGFGLTLALLALPGCGAAPDEREAEPVGQASAPIKGGYLDKTDPNVVGVAEFQSGWLYGICTGSLIAPNVVLTARHCVAPVNNDSAGVVCKKVNLNGMTYQATTFGKNFAAKDMGVTTKATMSEKKDASYHLVTEILTPASSTFCGNDIAILILTKGIDPAEAAPLVPRVDLEVTKGEAYYAIGFGAVQNDANGTGSGQRRRRDDLFIDCPGAECPNIVKLGVFPQEFVGDQGICQGDSGGPSSDLQQRVVGITSRGPNDCTSPVYTDVFAWGQWVKDAVLHGAEVGGYAAAPWANGWPTDPAYSFPVGESCTQPTDCGSNHCIDDGVAQYCTRLCNDLAPCVEGYTCDADQQVCLQKHDPPKPKPVTTSSSTTGGDTTETGGCAMAPLDGEDPTKPVPWVIGTALLAFALIRRRQG
ncbi:MAG: trypsin-like serine protease [Minicystis sp.]